METVFSYVLSLLLVPLSLYLISFIRKNGSNATENLPPGSKGWPLLGEAIHFAFHGPQKFFKTRMEKHSNKVFQSSLLGQDIAVFCGAEGNRFLFKNENKLVSFWLPPSVKKAFGFPELMEKSLSEVQTPIYGIRHDLFKIGVLKEFVPVMDALARKHFDNHWLNSEKMVKVYPMVRKYTFDVACKLLMNVEDPEQIKKLSDPFNLIVDGTLSLPINFPGTTYWRGLKGSKKVREELMRIIKERRKDLNLKRQNNEMIDGTDVITKMLLEGGEFCGDLEICFNLLGLLMAGYETTSSITSAIMNHLAQLPHIYDEVFKEQMEIAKSKGPNELLKWDDIKNMKYSWNVARESMRLAAPAQGGFKEATTEFTYAGFTIPKGTKTYWTVYTSHMNPEYFPEPQKFDPSRFEGRGPAPYTFIPFGGGERTCAGIDYARAQILVFMHNVVTRFKLEKVIPNEKILIKAAIPTPAYGLPVHLHPHDK